MFSASLSFSMASAYFFASRSSCAALRGLASLALLVGFSSASAGRASSQPARARIAVPSSSRATAGTRALMQSFDMEFTSLPPELGHVDEADLLQVIALCSRQHLRHDAVLRAPVGTQVNLGLRILVALGVE